MTTISKKNHADYSDFNDFTSRDDTFEMLLMSYESLCEDQRDWVCNLSNAASLLWHAYKSLNVEVIWAGFYTVRSGKPSELLLGPFQGKVACQSIPFGQGVCGTAADSKETQLVSDVSKFSGHIACDGETKSEIVVPIVSTDGKTLGVIDLDCGDFNGFGESDKIHLEKLAKLIAKTCDF
ncbi:similar to Saccharomyces cerevisiae YKL069W Methionine-R-sulfoxide reductase [Maudiozyma saulgeensis]|uniref:Similar to Saccharomyces cerevisiae YKL069W Methionine-R-sulfoxide reductase n=1 Tax=Maudiozyma saulgeensis TaxID=1789683 RepID=A0A1X7QWI1_9SACH|nr:similar to Saccharomyces cerevisiae YKL069W Methionine-R-sulfoxide reductase [Kazachstania saulgeensis]